MICLIDNYDSFSYNLYQMIGELEPEIEVYRNDELSPEKIFELQPEAIIISPGPGAPADAGIIENLISIVPETIPVLGICLGHQAICEVFGTPVIHAPKLMHGKQSEISYNPDHFLFKKCTAPLKVARYHSLAADPKKLSDQLEIIASSEDGQIMGVQHISRPIYGLQFHPESVLTPQGKQILKNFIEEIKHHD